MKVLWLSHFVPFPPRGGARQRSFNLIRFLSQKHEVFLIALNHSGEPKDLLSEHVKQLRSCCADVQVWGLPHSWKGLSWWARLAVSPLRSYPYECLALSSQKLVHQWQTTVSNYTGALVHYDSIDLALFFTPPGAHRRTLNHHNCESAMTYRRAQKEPNLLKKAFLRQQAHKLESLERASCHQFDVNLVVSEADRRNLRSVNPDAHIHLVENGTDTDYFTPSKVTPEPMSLIFAGDLSWYPNVSAIQFFVHEVWPLLKREIPEARLYLAGRLPAPAVVRIAERVPGIVLAPDPEDIRPWLARAEVFVCPITDGGGTRLKILDAFAMGKPVVTTTIGCEGIHATPGDHLLVADTPQDFAAQTLLALRDESLRRRLGTRARTLAEQRYNWQIIGDQLLRAYNCALDRNTCTEGSEGTEFSTRQSDLI